MMTKKKGDWLEYEDEQVGAIRFSMGTKETEDWF